MATLILRSACAPTVGRTASGPGHDGASFRAAADASLLDGRAIFASPSSAGGGGTGPRSSFRGGSFVDGDGPASSSSSSSSPPPDDERSLFLDRVASRPLRCDLTLVPRLPDDAVANDGDDPATTLRLADRRFHPCGTDNVISVDERAGGGGEYLLSLTRCRVDVGGASGGGGESAPSIATLPVSARPSTFEFSLLRDHRGLSSSSSGEWEGGSRAHYYYAGVGGAVVEHRVGEIYTTFDYSAALGTYRESLRARLDGGGEGASDATCAENATHSSPPSRRPWNYERAGAGAWRSNDAGAILRALDEETRFVERTVAALGCAGAVLVAALVRTLWKMTSSESANRRARRSNGGRAKANNGWRHGVPREINAVDASDVTSDHNVTQAVASEEGRNDADLTSPRDATTNSPIFQTRDATAEDDNGDELQGRSGASTEHGKAGHETLHLISPITPPLQSDSRQGQAAPKQSPRHWYEDFLSPPNRSKDDARDAGKHGVSRTLFSPPDATSEEDAPIEILPLDGHATAKARSTTRSFPAQSPLDRELSCNTPIRSAFSPPPNDVSLMHLSSMFDSSFGDGDSSSSMSRGEDQQFANIDGESSAPSNACDEFSVSHDNLHGALSCEEQSSDASSDTGTVVTSGVDADEAPVVSADILLADDISALGTQDILVSQPPNVVPDTNAEQLLSVDTLEPSTSSNSSQDETEHQLDESSTNDQSSSSNMEATNEALVTTADASLADVISVTGVGDAMQDVLLSHPSNVVSEIQPPRTIESDEKDEDLFVGDGMETETVEMDIIQSSLSVASAPFDGNDAGQIESGRYSIISTFESEESDAIIAEPEPTGVVDSELESLPIESTDPEDAPPLFVSGDFIEANPESDAEDKAPSTPNNTSNFFEERVNLEVNAGQTNVESPPKTKTFYDELLNKLGTSSSLNPSSAIPNSGDFSSILPKDQSEVIDGEASLNSSKKNDFASLLAEKASSLSSPDRAISSKQTAAKTPGRKLTPTAKSSPSDSGTSSSEFLSDYW